jgi:hypothetical protein
MLLTSMGDVTLKYGLEVIPHLARLTDSKLAISNHSNVDLGTFPGP